MTLGEEMFWINERLRFVTLLLDDKERQRLRAVAIAVKEEISKEMEGLKEKRRRLISKGEKLLNEQ